MVIASELKEGVAIRIDRHIYRVLEVESKVGAAKLGGVVKTKLTDVKSGRMWEPHFRSQERLEDLEIDRRMMEFLFSDGDTCTFMNPDTYEQIAIPRAIRRACGGWRYECPETRRLELSACPRTDSPPKRSRLRAP